eukprot:PhF_6_TR9258/c3_g2_i7/m.14674
MEAVGAIALREARQADGGQDKWDRACRLQEQLQLCANHLSGGKEHVFVFGGLLSFGIWDGASDIDFASLNIESLATEETAPSTPAIEHDKVKRMWRCLTNLGLPLSSMQSLTMTRVPVLRHMKCRISIGSCLNAVVRFNKDLPKDTALQEFIAAVNRRNVPFLTCKSEDELGRSLTFVFNSMEDTMKFALAVSGEVGEHKVTDCSVTYNFAPEIASIDFDLSFRAFGVRNSWLQRHYLMQHRCARLGAIIIKKWAKNTGFSDARNGYLTSYAAVIMWIFYLLEKGLIREYVQPQEIPSVPPGSKNLRGLYKPLATELDPHDERELALELGTLLHGFFKYYGTEFDWANRVVSLNHRGGNTKARLGWTEANQVTSADHIAENVYYLMCIEDPYEANCNLGRRIDESKWIRMKSLFPFAVTGLEGPTPNVSPVFAKPLLWSKEKAFPTLGKEVHEYVSANYKKYPDGIPIDKLTCHVCAKFYGAWVSVQEEFDYKFYRFVRDCCWQVAILKDKTVYPPHMVPQTPQPQSLPTNHVTFYHPENPITTTVTPYGRYVTYFIPGSQPPPGNSEPLRPQTPQQGRSISPTSPQGNSPTTTSQQGIDGFPTTPQHHPNQPHHQYFVAFPMVNTGNISPQPQPIPQQLPNNTPPPREHTPPSPQQGRSISPTSPQGNSPTTTSQQGIGGFPTTPQPHHQYFVAFPMVHTGNISPQPQPIPQQPPNNTMSISPKLAPLPPSVCQDPPKQQQQQPSPAHTQTTEAHKDPSPLFPSPLERADTDTPDE